MKNFSIQNYQYNIKCDFEPTDTRVEFEAEENMLSVFITAQNDRPQFVNIKWNFKTDDNLFVLGDAWERSYGELCFKRLSENERPMPWYFVATDKSETYCFGVKTQPNSFVCFTYSKTGISAKIDCRNGGGGVKLNGRRVKLCTFVYAHFNEPPFESLSKYCKILCEKPVIPSEKIYGGNNWYYAYGESSYAEIIRDAKLQAELAEGIENRPFMVVDDGWEDVYAEGLCCPNKKFTDMKALANEIKSFGVRPGIWTSLLANKSAGITPDMCYQRGNMKCLDPTNQKVRERIVNQIGIFRDWGYELLKHDFSTKDLFGDYGKDLTDTVTNFGGWHFQDETKTNAEIVLDFYRLIKNSCGDMLIIGCNTVSHLCAGLVHINRTGDDTSGREWARTRKMGVNTLAFRLAQNNSFYLVDADCVGILGNNIPWTKNRQWLNLLSKSDTALFTSCAVLTDEQKEDIKNAYCEIQSSHTIKPVDFFENLTPCKWEIDEKAVIYDWN